MSTKPTHSTKLLQKNRCEIGEKVKVYQMGFNIILSDLLHGENATANTIT